MTEVNIIVNIRIIFRTYDLTSAIVMGLDIKNHRFLKEILNINSI